MQPSITESSLKLCRGLRHCSGWEDSQTQASVTVQQAHSLGNNAAQGLNTEHHLLGSRSCSPFSKDIAYYTQYTV